MATITDLPAEYRATAERIPTSLLGRLSAAEAVARVLHHDGLVKTAGTFSDGASARMFFDLAAAALLDELVDLPPELLAKGAALITRRMSQATAAGSPVLRRLVRDGDGQVHEIGPGHYVKTADGDLLLTKALPPHHRR
jgi:hypothetical protein